MRIWLDLETRSRQPLRHGTAKYATDVEVIIAAWKLEFSEGKYGCLNIVDCTKGGFTEHLAELVMAAETADEIWAHNAEFDRTMLDASWWWPRVPLERWRCTAALARMHGLPGGLDKLSTIFKLPVDEAKDKRGSELIRVFCIPGKDGKYTEPHEKPKEWDEFCGYGGQDVIAMIAVHRNIPKWNATPRMWKAWHTDQKVNARGVAVDLPLCESAVAATTKAKRRLAVRTDELTMGAVEATTQRNRLLAFMEGFGVDLPDLTADTVERRLDDESLPEYIKELLRIRQQASKASTAKYQRAINHCTNGRLRNLLVFCGANRTGRFAGRTIQPQNLPRPKHERWDIDNAIDHFVAGTIDAYAPDDVLGLASSCLRGMLIAAPGRKLTVADLANIEGRFMAWIAGEQWKLDAFARYDRKEGPDLYKIAYARCFNIDPLSIADEGDQRRQIGKVMELALQYYGGVGAFCAMAETYGLRLDELADAASKTIPHDVWKTAEQLWQKAQKRRRTYGLSERVWTVCQSLVLMWRAAHPKIVGFWYALDNAVKAAVRNPDRVYQVGEHIAVDRRGNWLRVRLPSGRFLCYPAPRIEMEGDSTSFVGVNPYTKQWGRISTYSGKLTENIVQGGSADILIDGMVAAEDAEYCPVLTVHDEILAEPPNTGEFTDKGLSKLMVSNSPWAVGLPLTAKGFTTQRYRK